MDEQKPEETPAGQPAAEQQIPAEPAPAVQADEVPEEVQQEPQEIAQPTQVYVPRAGAIAAEAKPSKLQKLKDFSTECKRVLRVTKKPDKMEFRTIVKIAGIGMVVIGFLGFFVHFVKELVF